MTEFYVMYGQTEATARISCMEPDAGKRNQEVWVGLWTTCRFESWTKQGNDLPRRADRRAVGERTFHLLGLSE